MTSPRISISRYGESSTFGSVPDRRHSDLRMPQFFKRYGWSVRVSRFLLLISSESRLFKFPQMDFEMAIWEMTHLLIAPKKVFKSIFYQKRPFPTLRLWVFLCKSLTYVSLQKRGIHTTAPTLHSPTFSPFS